jgi:hypothetical protein
MHTITGLQEVRRQVGLDTGETGDDARLLAMLEAATATIEQRTRRNFLPYEATLSHPVHSAQELFLRDDLLDLQSVTDSDGTTIPLSAVVHEGGLLRLTDDRQFAASPFDAPADARVEVSGVWGYHPDAVNMWVDSEMSLSVQVSSSATFLILNDTTEPDGTPVFSPGQLLKLNDEMMRVVAVDTAADIVTVLRGVRGTTVASHTNFPPLLIYHAAADARQLCVRWAAWLYRSADRLPEPLPEAFLQTVRTLRRVRVMS